MDNLILCLFYRHFMPTILTSPTVRHIITVETKSKELDDNESQQESVLYRLSRGGQRKVN